MNLLENFLSQVNNTSTWLTILLDATIKGAVILLAASVLCFFLRRTSAAARHLVWSLALISVLALPVFSMLLPGWNLPVLPKITIIERPTDAAKTIDEFFSSTSGNAALQEHQMLPNITTMEQQAEETKTFDNILSTYSGGAAIQENQLKSPETVPSSSVNENPNGLTEIQAQISTITPNAISESPSAGLNWSAWVVIIWLIGALSVFARMLTGVIGVHIIKRRAQPVIDTSIVNLSHRIAENLGLKRRFTLLKSSRTRVPMTLGFFKPAVLLPEDAETWSPSRQKVVLLHELAHIKRSDIVYNVISQAVAALYWFNPLVWYAHHVLYAERERACDDYVIVSGVKSTDYANHLLDIARSLHSEKWISFAPVTMARRSQLEWRMRAILDPKKCRRALKPVTTIATCLIVAALVMPFAAMQPVEKEVKINEEQQKQPAEMLVLDEPGSHGKISNPQDENEDIMTGAAAALDKIKSKQKNEGMMSQTEVTDISIISVTDIEESLPEESDAQQQQRNQLIANVIRSLIDSLKSENTDVKMEAVFTLSYLIGASSDYLKDSSLLDALIPLMKDKDADIRLVTLNLVEKFEESEAALEALLDAIHDENAKIREEACDFLGDRIKKISQTEAAEIPVMDHRILNALKDAMNDEEPKVRMTALEYFRYIPESDALGPLIAALKDKDERVRMSAIEYLSSFENPEARDALISTMNDSSAYVQLTIVRALNVIKRGITRISSRTGINIMSDSELDELDLKMFDVIINALQNENYRIRNLAIQTISRTFVAEKSFDALIAAVKDENPRVRRVAVNAMGRINDPRVIQILIAALKDEDISVRMTAATELGRIRNIRENLPEEKAQQQKDTLKAVQKEKTEDIQKSVVEQSGNIEGYVTDKNTGQPLAGVNIFLSDTTYTRKDSIHLSGITTFTYDEIKLPVSDLSWLRANQSNITVLTNKPYIRKNQRTAVTDEKGYYIIRNVPPGIYSLIAKKEGYFSNVRDNVQVETGKTTRLDFNLTEGVEDIDIQAYKGIGNIDGYVTDKDTKQPVIGVTISIDGTPISAQTDEKGYYIIPNVPQGTYTVSASRIGYETVKMEDVQVLEEKTVTLNYNLTPLKEVGDIVGYITDKITEQPLAGVNIFLEEAVLSRQDTTSRIRALTYDEVIELPVSDLRRLLAAQSSIQVITNVRDTLRRSQVRDIRDIRMRGRSQEVVLTFGGFSTQVTLPNVPPRPLAVSDEEGYYLIQNVPQGAYNLSVATADYIPQTRKNVYVRDEITATWNFYMSLVNSGGKIDGYVTDRDTNQPLAGVNVTVNGAELSAQTDENGYFMIENVRPGVYTVTASITGYRQQTQENVRVTVGVITQLYFELTVIKEAAEGIQDTEQKQEYMATVLLRDSTIKKLDNVDFIIPDRIRMTTDGLTIPGKNVKIFPSKSDHSLQKMSVLESVNMISSWYSSVDKRVEVVQTVVHVKIYYDDGKVVTDAQFHYDYNSKIMVKGIDETTQKEWSVELDKIKEIIFTLK